MRRNETVFTNPIARWVLSRLDFLLPWLSLQRASHDSFAGQSEMLQEKCLLQESGWDSGVSEVPCIL